MRKIERMIADELIIECLSCGGKARSRLAPQQSLQDWLDVHTFFACAACGAMTATSEENVRLTATPPCAPRPCSPDTT